MIRRTAMVILYLPQQTNTCFKSATKTLEDNSTENIFKKQQFLPEACNFIKKRLSQRCFSGNLLQIFRTPFYNASGGLLCLHTFLMASLLG